MTRYLQQIDANLLGFGEGEEDDEGVDEEGSEDEEESDEEGQEQPKKVCAFFCMLLFSVVEL